MSFLKHIGTPRHSGRYPWGSGGDNQQRNKSFLGMVDDLEKQGLSEALIAKGLGITTTELRTRKSIIKTEKREADRSLAVRLKDKGLSNVAIGKRMKLNESSIRALLDPTLNDRFEVTNKTAALLIKSVEEKNYIDVGAGVEQHLGISRTKLNMAISLAESKGYKLYYVKAEQVGTGKFTSMKVLVKPDTPYAELSKNRDKIKMITEHSADGGRTFLGLKPIESVSSDRVLIRYKEDGGSDKDGVIELRRNTEDLSLGNSKYAQVRIGVDGSHYLKGMAMYSDQMPKGVDIIYNTKKPIGTDKYSVFKKMERDKDGNIDSDNPFGSVIKKDGQRRALNIVNEEGDWGEWSKSISSQVLSKQSIMLATRQLKLALDLKKEEFAELTQLTNPAVKASLLKSFSDDADSSAEHLKAAALPRQASHVILPITTMKPTEIYAPGYNNGEHVVLIRHPHGGTFEIPQLVVNNKNPLANSLIKQAKDAVGIHPNVAAMLSGADFDGDTVLVIPNPQGLIKTSKPFSGLKNFDPIESYPPIPGMKVMSARTKQLKMGEVSNLITDMTIKGANESEITRAVRHSMVVIDAEKHKLNYTKSAVDHNIADLKTKYQGGPRAGASTIISKAGSEIRVPVRKEHFKINKLTGEKIYENTGETYTNKKGQVLPRLTTVSRMSLAKDARSLSSGGKMEEVYVEHANALKSLANKARLLMLKTEYTPYSPSAKQTYSEEAASLKAKLAIAYRNKPLERQAQLLANKVYQLKKDAYPDMTPAEMKKIKGQALTEARNRVGAKKIPIVITDKEWEAIQLGAISTSSLKQILLNADTDQLKQRAMPRTSKGISTGKLNKANAMLAAGYTQAEVASAIGVSTTLLSNALK